MQTEQIRYLPKPQFMYLLRVAPNKARYWARVLACRKGSATMHNRAMLYWRKWWDALPEQFTKHDIVAVGGKSHTAMTWSKKGYIRVVEGTRSTYEKVELK